MSCCACFYMRLGVKTFTGLFVSFILVSSSSGQGHGSPDIYCEEVPGIAGAE